MQDRIVIPTCFFSSARKINEDDRDMIDHHHHPTAVTRSGQSAVTSIYRTKIAGRYSLVTVTWCRNSLLQHGLSVSVEGAPDDQSLNACKVELKPWLFWRRHGSKRLVLAGGGGGGGGEENKKKEVSVVWDLRAAKFQGGGPEPESEYFVAVTCDGEVVLLLGDMKKDGYKRTGCRPALIDPALVTRKEHVFAKRKFSTRAKFHEKGKVHEISIECNSNTNNYINGVEPEMEIRLDGQVLIHVKHLQWKFRGNESIFVEKLRIEVFWDVHDWLFSPGLRHALFIFKPVSSHSSSSFSESMSSSVSSSSSSGSFESLNAGGSPEFCLFVYAWKAESEKNL